MQMRRESSCSRERSDHMTAYLQKYARDALIFLHTSMLAMTTRDITRVSHSLRSERRTCAIWKSSVNLFHSRPRQISMLPNSPAAKSRSLGPWETSAMSSISERALEEESARMFAKVGIPCEMTSGL